MRKAIWSLKIYRYADEAMGELSEKLDWKRRQERLRSGVTKISNGKFAKFPIWHRFENGEVERCKECNRKDRNFTNEELRRSRL
jgi:hypothetical protein